MGLQVVLAGRIIGAAPKPCVPMVPLRSLSGQGQARRRWETRRPAEPQVEKAPLADHLLE